MHAKLKLRKMDTLIESYIWLINGCLLRLFSAKIRVSHVQLIVALPSAMNAGQVKIKKTFCIILGYDMIIHSLQLHC